MHDSCKFDPAIPKQQVGWPIFLSLASLCLLIIALTGAPISFDFTGLGVHPNIAAAMGGGNGNGGSNAGIGDGAEGGDNESADTDPGNSGDHNRAGAHGGGSDGTGDGSDGSGGGSDGTGDSSDGSGGGSGGSGGDGGSQTSLGGSGGLFGQDDGGGSGPGIGSGSGNGGKGRSDFAYTMISPEVPHNNDRFFIVFNGEHQYADVQVLAAAIGFQVLAVQYLSHLDQTLVTVETPEGSTAANELVQIYAAISELSSADGNALFSIASRFLGGGLDALYSLAAGEPRANSAQFADTLLNLPAARRIGSGDGIVVAVVDSGIDINHPDLAGRIIGVEDVVDGNPEPFEHFHGTAVAGIIAANGETLGVAPAAQILAIRVFAPDAEGGLAPGGSTIGIVKAINLSITHDVDIINFSFTGPSDPLVEGMVATAIKEGLIVVAAAGNEGPRIGIAYPAAYPGVISVTATDAQDRIYEFATRGDHVALAAPGVDILAPVPGGFGLQTGTSFAAAQVSGIAALILEQRRDLSFLILAEILSSTSIDLGDDGRDEVFGGGRVDALAAVEGAKNLDLYPMLARGRPRTAR